MTQTVEPHQSTEDTDGSVKRRQKRARAQRTLAQIQRTHPDRLSADKSLRSAIALSSILSTIEAHEDIIDGRELDEASYSAGFRAALQMVEGHILDEIR